MTISSQEEVFHIKTILSSLWSFSYPQIQKNNQTDTTIKGSIKGGNDLYADNSPNQGLLQSTFL